MRDRGSRLHPSRFADDVLRAVFALVRVDRSPSPSFARGLVEHFDATYPGRFVFGTLSRATAPSPFWWTENFKTALGPIRGGVVDGTYLFDGGVVVGQHVGDDAARMIPYFDEIVVRRARVRGEDVGGSAWTSSGPSSAGSSTSSGQRASSPPPREPPRPQAPPEDDPYVVLGVLATATDEEVRAAWREQMKLNHPDRVAHLSPALQKFALAQTVAIQQAYDAITARRRR